MSEFEITCVNKPDRFSQHEHITHIGNYAGNWRLTREVAIQRIEEKKERYFTVDKGTGKKAYIGVVREPNKAPYLKTYADGQWNNNLLAQQECGSNCKVIA
jgi:hypothetical protein